MAKKSQVQEKKMNYFFTVLYALALIVLFLIFKPYLKYLVLGIVIVVLMYPINTWMKKKINNRMMSSLLMTLIVFLVILIPTLILSFELFQQTSNIVTGVKNINLTMVSEDISGIIGYDIDLRETIRPIISQVTEYVASSTLSLIESAAEILIGLFIMFFTIYYGFKEGDMMYAQFMRILPVRKEHKKQMKEEARKVLSGVIFGQMLVSVIQGVLGGIGFFIFGVPNPVLWGFLMAILAFVPFLGTPVVWLPAVIYKFSVGPTWAAIGLLLYSAILVMNIDNVVKPKLISKDSGMHPILVLVGIFGGLAVFGFIGMIIGPIVVALCILSIKFFVQEVEYQS